MLCLRYRCCCHKNKPTQKKDGPSERRDGFRVAVNRRMTGWTNWPSGWMDDCTDLREASLFARICRHSSFTSVCPMHNAQVCYFNNVWFMFLVFKKNFYLFKQPLVPLALLLRISHSGSLSRRALARVKACS